MRARDDAARAALRPLAPGERPRPVTAAALLAGLIAVGNLVVLLAGAEVERVGAGIVFCVVMLLAAVGMWNRVYWAVLGFQVLLGVALVYAILALLVASNLLAVLTCLAVLAICGPLFWALIRPMARMKMPASGEPGGRSRPVG